MNKAATPGLRFRQVRARLLQAGDIITVPGNWATVEDRGPLQDDGDGGTCVRVAFTLIASESTGIAPFDAEEVVPVLRPDPAMPVPGTRVRTPFGMGSVVYPDGVAVVCYDVPAQQPPVKLGLVPIDKIEVIESGRAAS